ncbi:uncharacterized protein MYCFIDRAFT_179160 [Pseudocercospora fijiensis CIRAD86]|uniref:Uncharacterized protein n=1 Tax=Pseudocercospora fijiensis (strain CIRAD86) TaxID=383855 RepID=M2ZEV9_PSEFD|nr:uncharacterized protein MYCFIDRAFT_179160 [Pseudocercospora fijiensis CIRAD86]EME77664.1 hypothetical protein MYCFIDRAFT_179160 [Pseudocercospora fijiensis CIRAD86]
MHSIAIGEFSVLSGGRTRFRVALDGFGRRLLLALHAGVSSVEKDALSNNNVYSMMVVCRQRENAEEQLAREMSWNAFLLLLGLVDMLCVCVILGYIRTSILNRAPATTRDLLA